MSATPPPSTAVTVAEACRQIGIGKTKFYELVGTGAIETFTIGDGPRPARRVDQAAIDAFKARNRTPLAAATT